LMDVCAIITEEERELRLQAEEQTDSGAGKWMGEHLKQMQEAHSIQIAEIREHEANERAHATAELVGENAALREKLASLQKSVDTLQSRRSGQTVVLKKTQSMLANMRAELQWLTQEKADMEERHAYQVHQVR
jgi:hypothetical protein